jgi:hypothetical protein
MHWDQKKGWMHLSPKSPPAEYGEKYRFSSPTIQSAPPALEETGTRCRQHFALRTKGERSGFSPQSNC